MSDLQYQPSAWGQEFHALTCEEALGAGAAGPGKTTVLLMDPLEQILVEHNRCQLQRDHEHYHPWGSSTGWALHLRRTLPMLEQTIQRSHRIFPQIDPAAEWNEQKKTWKFKSGFRFQFGHCAETNDWENFMSAEFCVAKGTRVVMGDGSLKAIEEISTNELVQTLEGPRRVIATWETGLKPCVSAAVSLDRETWVGTQLHPTTHPVLTTGSGFALQSQSSCRSPLQSRGGSPFWLDFESFLCGDQESPERLFSRVDWGTYSARFGDLLPVNGQLEEWCFPVALHAPAFHRAASSPDSATQCRVDEQSAERSDLKSRAPRQHPYIQHQDQQRADAPALLPEGYGRTPPDVCGGADARSGLGRATGSLPNCSACSDLHDGPFPGVRSDGRGSVQRQASAGGRAPTCSREHVQAGIPIGSPGQLPFYKNRYTGQERAVTEETRMGWMRARFAGFFQTFDISVEGANHYITELGLVNSNTHLSFDELTQFNEEQYDQIKTRVRSSDAVLRKMLKVRAMSNPVQRTDAKMTSIVADPMWVRRYFVDPFPAGRKMLAKKITRSDGTTELRRRIYLPATLFDNPDKNFVHDYEARLLDAKPHIRAALLYGDWYITVGSFYAEVWNPELHVCAPFKIPRDWPRFRSMDWGFKKPGCVHWYARDPDGNLFVEKEYTFENKTAAEVALRIVELEEGMGIAKRGRSQLTGPADTQLWEQRGDSGKGKAEEMAELGVNWTKAEKRRERNAERIYQRLGDHDNGTITPGLVFFKTCVKIIQTLPGIQADPKNPECPMDGGEDHWHDSLGYGCAYASRDVFSVPKDPDDDEDDDWQEPPARGQWGYGLNV